MTFLVLTLFSLDVQAQEEPEEPAVLTFWELGWVPPFQVAAFVDDTVTGDCDRIDARYGRCIERVTFISRSRSGGHSKMMLTQLTPNHISRANSVVGQRQ